MKILIDMNLSPDWTTVFKDAGFETLHWIEVGNLQATDQEILSWAADHGYVLFTHDLDFGSILAATGGKSPSVLQVRTQDVRPQRIRGIVFDAMNQFRSELEQGVLISIDESKARARLLPIRP